MTTFMVELAYAKATCDLNLEEDGEVVLEITPVVLERINDELARAARDGSCIMISGDRNADPCRIANHADRCVDQLSDLYPKPVGNPRDFDTSAAIEVQTCEKASQAPRSRAHCCNLTKGPRHPARCESQGAPDRFCNPARPSGPRKP